MKLKSKLLNSELTVGSWIMIGHPVVAEIMAAAGFDWLAIDLEHTTISLDTAQTLIQAIESKGVAPLVRLTSNDSDQIKRVMDAGAHGVIVPMIASAEEAARAVSAVYYPPRGTRGVGLARAQGYGNGFKSYCDWLESEATVIVQIEHIDGVANIHEILAVDGVDGYFIGPYDLSASMGIPGDFDNSKLLDAIERVRQAGLRAGKPGGLHVVEADVMAMREKVAAGFTFIAYSIDTRMLDGLCRSHLKDIRGEG